MIVWWGPELRFLYNDAYMPLLGDKHPALGRQPCGKASMAGCQNSEDDTLPCTNSTGRPVRPATESTATASRLVGTRSAVTPGSNVCIFPPPGRRSEPNGIT
jgi:hypothetical protein